MAGSTAIMYHDVGGQPAVILDNDSVRATVLPQLGGKIASLKDVRTGFEFAAQPDGPYGRPSFGDDFAAFDASGLDDAFPSVLAHVDDVNNWRYPDHGEIWSGCFVATTTDGALGLRYASPHLPYRYEKTVVLTEDGIRLDYRIENTGDAPFPCIWTFHGLLRYDETMRIVFPEGSDTIVNTMDSAILGPAGRRHSLTGPVDLHHPPKADTKSMTKYYLDGPVAQGRCGVWYAGAGLGCVLRYDPTVLPYLGVWITAGGFRGDYNWALEPSNGFYDGIDEARRNEALYSLEPGVPLEFTLALDVVRDEAAFRSSAASC